LIAIAYGIEVWQPLTYWRRAGLADCDQVWAISAHTAERMQAANGALANVVVLHNALDPFWAEAASAYQLHSHQAAVSGRRSLLTVSRLSTSERGKGHAAVIRALPRVAQEIPDVRYDVVGTGDLVPELRELTARCHVADRVFFHENIPDEGLHRFYSACDIFVMPSKKEGFGYVYLEAMYFGKPVVAGCADAGPEVVQHRKTGLIVEPDNIDELALTLISLLSDDARRREMGAAGRYVVEYIFSYNRFSEEVNLYLAQARSKT
jgi:glycosyltransferase involved in cell wall biosynthesis